MPARAEDSRARALARLYCPPTQRPLLAALLEIEAEVRAGCERDLGHEVAHARLAWWREECTRLAAGAPLHPLSRALHAQLAPHAAPLLKGVSGLVDTATWDLATATFERRAELEAYCERWSGALIGPLAMLSDPAADSAPVRSLGRALRELELLNDLPAEARRGRIRLPLDELEAAGAVAADLVARQYPPALVTLVRARHRAARAALAAAVAGLGGAAQARLRAVLVWAQVLTLQSRRIEGALPRATTAGDHRAPLDGWRAWRAARQADAGRLSLAAHS